MDLFLTEQNSNTHDLAAVEQKYDEIFMVQQTLRKMK